MSKQYYFFKNLVRGALDENTFFTSWDHLESWISQNNWMAIFFIIFLGIIFEIILIKIYTSFQKTPALPEKSSLNTQESEDSSLQSMTFDNYSIHSSSEERVDHFSERTMSSPLTSEESEGNVEDTTSQADELLRAGTSESKYQVSHLSESYMSFSNGSSSSLFHSEIKEIFLSQTGSSENEAQTIQYSSKKLFSIMKSNKNKTFMFSSDFNFSRTSRISSESEDLDMAPCPPAHLFLSRDQVRLLEENVRHQIPLKSKGSLERKVTYLYSRSQESLIQNHHSAQMNISAQTQDSSPGQNVIQNQSFYEAQLTSQPQQLVHNQEVIDSQQDTDVRSFSLPQNLMRKPLSGSTQDSIQAQVVDRRQHLVKDPFSVETQDSIKSTESDKYLDEPQCSVWPKDSDKKEDSLQKRNTFSKNARHLVLTLTPNSVAEGMPPLQKIKGKILEQIVSSEFNQNSVSDSAPVLPERQKKQRKILHSKSKFNAKVPSEKPKKAASSQAHQITVCHTSEHGMLGCHYNMKKKKELFQRKETSGKALSLTYVSKLVVPYIKKYSRKNLVQVVPDIKVYTHFLLKQEKSLDVEEVNYAGSFEKRGTSGNTENKKQQSRDKRGLKNIPPKIAPQPEESFMVNTFQLKASCSSSVETSWKNKESLKYSVTQAKGTGIAEFFHTLKSKGTCDLCIPKHQTPLAETVSEPLQEFVSPPNMKSNRGQKTQEGLRTAEQPHPPLSQTEEVPTSPPERSFPKGNTQCKTLKVVLESPDVNLLISLEAKKHDSSEQSADRDIQERIGDVIQKKEKAFSLHITGCGDPHESEGLEYNRANMRDQGVPGAPHRTAHTATSGPPDRKMHSRLEAKTEASRIVDFSHSAVRQEEFPDEKISPTANYIEKKCIAEKPQGHDKEERVLQEAALDQTDFRLSLKLKLQNEFVKFEIEQINSGNRETQNIEKTAQPQSVSTQTIWETSPCPIVGLFQVEKMKQSADRPTGRESTDPKKPLKEPEKLPVGESSLDTFASRVPFSEDLRKIPGPIAEEKQDLTRVFPAVALGSFISQMLQSSYLKRQQIRKILPGTPSVFSPQRVVTKAKKPAGLLMAFSSRRGIPSHRKRPRDNLKSLMKKQKPQGEIMTEVLLNVTYPHKTIFLHTRRQSRLNTEPHSLAKPTQEKPQGKKEECPDFITKGGVAGHRPEAKLQDEVRGDKMAPPKPALSGHWAPQSDVYPETELQTEKEMQGPVPAGEATAEPTHSHVMEPAHGAEGGPTAQADLRCSADSQTTPSPGAARAGNPLTQARESDGPGYESDVRETGYFFVERDLSDLSATSPKTFHCHPPILSHSKVKKNRVRFSHIKCIVRPKSGHMKTVTPSRPQMFTIRGHRKKLESCLKSKCEKIIQATGLVYEFLNTLYPPGPGRLQRDQFGHPPLIRGEPAVNERRLHYADFLAEMKNAFSYREEKVQDGKEEEQNTVPGAAPQHTQHLRPSMDHVDRQVPGLDFLTQEPPVSEQDVQHRTRFPETALHPDLPLGPRDAEDIQKTNKTGSDLTAPVGAEIPPPQSGIVSFDQCFKTTPECGLPFRRKPEKEQDSYFVATNSALQESVLQSSHPLEMYVPAYKRKRNTLQLARQHKAVSCRYRTRRRERLSSSRMLDGMQSQGQQRRKKTKHPEQSKNFADVFLDIIHSKVPVLINVKMSSGLNGGRDMQRITRLDHMQVMREKSPNGRGVCCLDYAEMTNLSHSVRDGEEVAGEHAGPPAPEASQDFLLDTCQKKNRNLTELDEELKQPGSTNIQVQPQPHRTPAVLGSASCPLLYRFQLGKLEGLARFLPPTSREAKTDGIIFSASKCGIPSGVSHHKGQWPGGAGKKETVTFDVYEPASATSRRKRNFKQYSDMRTLVNSAWGIRKANKPSILYILSVKGGAGPHCGEEKRGDLSPNVKEMAPATVSPFMSGSPGSSTYSKTGREKDMLGEKRLGSQQVKQAITPHGGTVPADETKEANHPDQKEGENEQETLLKDILQHSQHFIFRSGQRKELGPHESEDQVLDTPQLQPVDLVQVGLPKPSHWTHADTCCTARSQLHLLKAKESLAGQVLVATVQYGLPKDGSRVGELHRGGNEDKAEAQKDIQATVLEPSDVPTSNLPESDRQRKMFTRRALKSQMSSRCVVVRARKASQILNISGNGCQKNPPPKIQKSPISGFSFHRQYSGVPQGHTVEKREGLAQELPTTVPESWDLSTLALPVKKRKRNNLKLAVKENKTSPTCVTLKVKKGPPFLTFKVPRQGTSRHRRQFKRNLKIMMKQGQHVADIILNAISSFIPVSPDKKAHHVQTDLLWETGVSHKLLLQVQPAGGARAEARGESTRASSRHQDGEASREDSQHFREDTCGMKAPGLVKADLELEDSVRTHSLESPAAAQEPQRPALFRRNVIHSASRPESIADTFSSPTPVASDDKIDIEMLSTLKIEVDKPRVKTCSCTDPERERPAREWGVWKASSADTQNMSSNTRRRKEQCEKEEDDFPNTLPTSVPRARRHLSDSSLYVPNLGPCKSGLEQNSLEGRKTWNLSGMVQTMNQEKHIQETILKPVSRHVMNVLQVKTVKKRPDTQEGREDRAHLKSPLPKAGTSKVRSIQDWSPQDRDPRRKWDGPIAEEKAWNKNDLLRTVFSALDFPGLESSELKSQNYTLGRVGQKGMSPKHGPWKAEKLPMSRLLQTTRALPGSHRKKQLHMLKKRKEQRRQRSQGQLLFCTPGGAQDLPPASAMDKLLLAIVARGTLYNRAHHGELGGHTPEEKTEVGENLAPAFLGPFDSKNQQDAVPLSGKKIVLTSKCLTVKKKEPPISHIFKIDQFTTKCREMNGSNLKTQMKEMKPSHNVAETVSVWDTSDTQRQSKLKTELDRMPRSRHIQPAPMELPAEGLVTSYWHNTPGHAALCIPEEQEQKTDKARESRALTADLKPAPASMPVPPHAKTEPLPGAGGICDDASEKEHALNKAKVREEEEYEQQVMFRTTSQNTPPLEFGTAQGTGPGPFKSEAPWSNTEGLKDLPPQKTESDLTDQEAQTGVVEGFCPESSPCSKMHLPPREKQKKDSEAASGRKEHPGESPGEALPTSASRSPADETQSKPPWLRSQESPTDCASNTEGAGLLAKGKVGQLGLADQTSPKSACGSARELFQRKRALKNKALEEAVSTGDYTPIARGIGSLIMGKRGQRANCTSEALPKPASCSKISLLQGHSPGQQAKLESANMVCQEHAPPQGTRALKGSNVIPGDTQKSTERQYLPGLRQKQQHPRVPGENFPGHLSYLQNDAWLLPHLMALTRKALSEVSSVSNSTKALVLFRRGQAAAACECKPGWVVALTPAAQMKTQNAMLPCESREIMRHLNMSFPNGKKSLDEAQGTDAIPSGGAPKESARKKVQSHEGDPKAHTKVCLPGIFAHSLAIYLPALSESKRQMGRANQGLEKAMLCPKRRPLGLRMLVFSRTLNAADGGAPSGRPDPQQDIKEKVVRLKHSRAKPDLLMTSLYGFIRPSPHPRLNRETVSGRISNNGERTKQQILLKKQDRIKGIKLSLPLLPIRKDLPVLFNLIKQESKAEGGKEVDPTNVCSRWSSRPCPHWNSRLQVGGGKPRTARSCLLPPKLQASSKVGKISFAVSINRERLINVLESKQHSPLRKKEDRESIVHGNDLTLRELSATMGRCEAPTDDILSSIKKAKYTSKKGVEMTLEEMRSPQRAALKVRLPAYAQWSLPGNERKTLGEKYKILRIQSKSCPSISFLPYSEVIRSRKVKRIGTQFYFLQPQIQKSLDTGKTACKRPVSVDTSHSSKKAKEHIIQEQERVKTAKTLLSKKKKSSSSQEIQLAIKGEEAIEKMTSVVLTNTSTCTPAPSPLKRDPGIKKLGSVIEITKYSLPKRSQSDPHAVKKANKDSVRGSVSSDVQEAEVCPPQKEEANAKLSAKTDLLHPKEKGLGDKEALPGDMPSHTTEQDKGCAGSAGQGGPEATGEGELEAVRPASLASESSLAHHKPGQRAGGEEDREGITRAAISQLQPQKSPEGEKLAQTEPTGEDTSDIKMAQEHKPQSAEDRGDTQSIQSLMYPRGATSRAKILPLPPVLRTPREQAPPAAVPRDTQDKGGHRRERKGEPGEGPTNPSLPPLKINKGVEGPGGPRGVTGPFSPPSWDRESSGAGHLKYMLSPWRAIASNSERAEDTAGQREEKANVLKKEGARPSSAALRAKQCPPARILETETLQVSVTEHADGGLAGGSVRVVILSKMCPFLTFSTHLKLDAIKAEAGEPGTRSSAAHLELQESLPSGQTAPAEQGGCRGIKKAEHQAETENHGVQAAPRDGVKPPHGRDCEAETAPPPGVLRASQRCALCTSREAEGGVREKAEQGLGRAGDQVTPTGPPPPAPRPPLPRLALRREELFASTRLPLQRPRPACAGEARRAGPGGGMSSCNLTIQARRCLAYGKARDGENMKEERGRIFSKIMSVRAERPPFTRPPRRAPANARQPEEGIRSSRGEGRPGPALTDSLASLPSPPYLKRGPGRKEREDPPGVTKPHFPPRKIQDPCDSGERAQAKPSDRNVFKGQDGSKTAVEGELPPGRLGLRAQQSSPSRARGAGASRWETDEPESQTQKDKDLLMGLKSICSSFLTLPYFKCDLRGEGCVLRIIKLPLSQLPSQESSDAETTARPPPTGAALSGDRQELDKGPPQAGEQDSEEKAEMSREAEARGVDLETKKSPVLRAWTQSDPLRQTEAQAGKRAPGVVAPPTGAPRAAPLAGVEQAGEPTVTRASASSAHFPESSEAEKADRVEPGARELSAPPRHGAGSSPAGGAGHRAGRLLPARPGKEPPEGEDEPSVVLTTPSSPRRSWRPRRTEDKATQAERDPPALWSSARQRMSKAREAVPMEPAGGGAIKAVQNEEPREPPREERDRDSAVGQRGETHCTHITLKSMASPRPAVLHRTELHLPLPWRAPRQPQGRGKGPSPALRTVCVSRPPPRSLPVGRGPRVDEERLRAQRPSLLPPTSPASPDAEKAAGSEARGGDARKGGRRRPQSKCGPNLKTVDVNIRVRRREAGVAPVSRILEAQGLVLNVRALTGPRLAGEQESRIFLTRAFLCTPAALDLEPGSKADKTAPRVAGSSGPRGMLRGASDAQTTAPGEAADGDRALLAERGGGAPQQWTSDFLICVQGRKEPPQVKSKGDLRQLVLNSQDGDVYFTGFGAISSGKRLECLFPGQKAQSEKHKTETLSTFHSCPATKLAKRANQEEEAEPKGNSDCRAGAEGFASQPGETPGSPVSAKALLPPEPNAQPQDTLSKAAPGSADSDSGPNTPGEYGQRDDKVSQAAPAKGPAPQTRESCEDVTAAESSSPPKRNGANVLTTQAVLPSESGPQPGENASCPLSWPLPRRRQKTPLGTDVCKPMLLRPSTRLLPGSHAGAVRRGGARCLLASQQVENILEPLQNFLTPCWAFSPRPADQEGRDESGAGAVLNRGQKTLKREKGKLKLGTSMAVHVQERKTGAVSAKKEKLKKGRSNPPKHKGPSLKAAKSPAQTQAMAPRVKSCPGRRKPKKELGGTDQDTQPQTLLPKQVVLDSLYAYIPLPPKFEGWKGRVTMADLRRELSPKYLTINTPGHPVPHILDDLGRGVPSDRVKLEYDFTKPKMLLWRGEGAGAGVAIRRLSVAVVSPPPTTAGRVSERNPRRGRRIGLSEFPGKSADTREAPGSRISSSTPEEGAPGVPGAAPQEPQPFPAPEWQTRKPPGVAWEAGLSGEGKGRFFTPQTEDGPVPGHDFPAATRDPDSPTRERDDEAPAPLPAGAARERLDSCVTSTQTLSLPPPAGEAAPGGSQLGHGSGCASSPEPCLPEPGPDAGTPEAQPPASSPGPGPAPRQVASHERKPVAGARGRGEGLSPLLEAVKNMFESQLESLIQDKVCAEVRKQVGAHSSAAEPGPPCRAPAPGRPEAVLEHFTAREKRRLASHLRAKALGSKAGLMPQRVQLSSQKCRRHPGGGLSPGHGGGRLRPSGWSPGPRGERLLSGRGTVAAEVGPERSAQGAASLAGCRPSLPGSDSPGGEKVLTRSITPPPSRASSVPFADERPLSCVLQKFSTEEREKLLTHFSVRTLEIQMKSLPRMARESYAMAGAQGRRSPLAKCAHPALRAPKRRKRIVLLFEEKSLHQIDLDLQFKYQRFLLGLPVARMFPKSKALPKCIPESSPVARGTPAERRAEGGRLRVRAQVLGRHVSFKKSLPELASSIRKVLEPAPVRASDPGPQGVARQGEGHPRTFWAPPCPRGTVQQDTTVPPEAKSSVTPEKEKKCRVWFQEAEACKPSDSKLPASAPRSAGPCSSPTLEDASEGLKDAENWADVQERPSREGGAGEESLFWEVRRYFRREAGHILCGGQRGSWQGLPEAEKIQTSPPSEACPSQHTGSSGGHTPSGTPPSRGSRQSKKSRVSSQSDGAPRGLCGGALSPTNGGLVPSGASSCSSSDTTSGKTGRSLFASTESKVKLHPAKSQGRLHRGAERRERQRPTSDSPGKSSSRACAPRWAPSDLGDQPHPRRRPQDGGEEPPERGAHPPSRQKLARPECSEEASPPAERSRGPPFFYACVPADSLEVTPKTVRWAIPPKALKKRNFRLPLVAKVSSSSDLCSSSKHLLEAFLGSFSLVPPDWGRARGTRRPAGSAGLFSDE